MPQIAPIMETPKHPTGTPASELTDADLARRIAAADPDLAVDEEAELCGRYARRVYWYGLRHLKAEDRARDLVQEVFVVTLEKLRSDAVREPDRIGSFILGTARLVARSLGRTGSRDEAMEAADDLPASTDPTVSDPLARDLVIRCLAGLADRQRTVIVLSYYGEQSTDTIASSLGLTANNVRVIRHRGIEQLRSCLGIEDRGVAA